MRAAKFLVLAQLFVASPVWAGETYDLLFKTGTLDGFETGQSIDYQRDRLDLTKEEGEREEQIALELEVSAEGQARLSRMEGEARAAVLSTDATVGNPMAMFFMESTVREVARLTGGSPFYIRNRFKESLLAENPIRPVSLPFGGGVEAHEILLTPFADDKNRGRMGPFADLTLRFTVSPDVPGWYHSLTAEVPLPGSDGAVHVYRDAISLRSE